MYKNDELYNPTEPLNIEEDINGLRYEKVIPATDADVDGLHIRNLMMAYFSGSLMRWSMTAISTYWRPRSSACVTRKEPSIVTAKRSGMLPCRRWAAAPKSQGSKVWARLARENLPIPSVRTCSSAGWSTRLDRKPAPFWHFISAATHLSAAISSWHIWWYRQRTNPSACRPVAEGGRLHHGSAMPRMTRPWLSKSAIF